MTFAHFAIVKTLRMLSALCLWIANMFPYLFMFVNILVILFLGDNFVYGEFLAIEKFLMFFEINSIDFPNAFCL